MSAQPFPSITVVIPAAPAEESWPDVAPLPPRSAPVPTLPDALIPEPLRGWLADIAERVSIPLEFVAAPAIVSLGSIIGRALAIRPMRRDDWTVPGNLWGGIVGPPGTMKTPAVEQALRPLKRLVAVARQEFEDMRARQLAEMESFAAQKSAKRSLMEKAAKVGDGAKLVTLTRELQTVAEREAAAVKKERRYMTSDSTIEKLGILLNENPRGLLLVRDELMGWLRGLDRDDRGQDRPFYLESWNGTGSFTVDRVGRGTLHVDALCLSVVGGIQPGKLAAYVAGAVAGEDEADGLMQRLQVLVWPDEFGDWRGVDRWPEAKARDRAFRIFEGLSSMDGAAAKAEAEKDGLPFLRFASDAQGLFLDWRTDLEKRLRSDAVRAAPAFEAHLSKYRSLFPKLALIFHLAAVSDGAPAGPVSLEAAQLAGAWTDFLEAHARKVYADELSAGVSGAHALAAKIKAGKVVDGMAVRAVSQREWSGLRSSGDVFAAAETLEALGWVRVEETPTTDRGGRPSTILRLHPSLRKTRKEEVTS